MTTRTRVIVGMAAALTATGGLIAVEAPRDSRSAPAESQTIDFESPRPRLIDNEGQPVFAEPAGDSQVLTELPYGAIVDAVGQIQGPRGAVPWTRVRTRSGVFGWCALECGSPLTVEAAEDIRLQDEVQLVRMVTEAVRIVADSVMVHAGLHVGSPIEDFGFVDPIRTTESSARYNTRVAAIKPGTFFASNKYRIELDVMLYMDLNHERLSASTVRVERVDVVSNELSVGTSLGDVIEAFAELCGWGMCGY